MIIIDAENHVMGRLASKVAKMLLDGETVFIVNAEKVVISGRPKAVIGKYREKRARGDPYHGPFFPRNPERIFKRVVRGMLPYKKTKGMSALKRLKVFISVPEELRGKQFEKVPDAEDRLVCKRITLGEVSKDL